MALIAFDLGGTLIDDPFPSALNLLKEECRTGTTSFPFGVELLEPFFAAWLDENKSYKFPFASHYIQEEIWPARAALRFRAAGSIQASLIPLAIPALLARYREVVRGVIRAQPQLFFVRKALNALRGDGHAVVVASNDREFATEAMLQWSDLADQFTAIFTSEGLSSRYPGAEKPSPIFFKAVKAECEQRSLSSGPLVFVGDSEAKDIVPARNEGFRPVRFVRDDDPAKDTCASFNFKAMSDVLGAVRSALN